MENSAHPKETDQKQDSQDKVPPQTDNSAKKLEEDVVEEGSARASSSNEEKTLSQFIKESEQEEKLQKQLLANSKSFPDSI